MLFLYELVLKISGLPKSHMVLFHNIQSQGKGHAYLVSLLQQSHCRFSQPPESHLSPAELQHQYPTEKDAHKLLSLSYF